MQERSHVTVVADQFGSRASAYVTSSVHSQGEDLAQIVRLVERHPKARVLDLGCGGGHVSFNSAPHVAEVVAYDLSEAMLQAVEAEAARRGLTNIVTRAGRAEALPFADGEFDFVLCRFSAHHWGDLHAGLREARRVLRPGGRVAFGDVVAPDGPALDTFLQAVELFRDPSHARDYSVREWEVALRAAGFTTSKPTLRRLRMDFSTWIERMRTPPVQAEAIVSLQGRVAKETRDYFEFEPDGSFTFDTMVIEGSR